MPVYPKGRFNGAAGITRRKHRHHRCFDQRHRNRFNGAAGITRRKHFTITATTIPMNPLQWGRRNYPAETFRTLSPAPSRVRSFNGAAGITRRKRLLAGAGIIYALELQWGRRNYPAETGATRSCRSSRRSRFNGAAGITRRKPSGPVVEEDAGHVVLQWGRRNYPAETAFVGVGFAGVPVCFNGAAGITRRKQPDDLRNRVAELEASMGPPELPGGNVHCKLCEDGYELPLQWGRRNYPAETLCAQPDRTHHRTLLQWGRRNYPAETGTNARSTGFRSSCFNGAAGITRRKLA